MIPVEIIAVKVTIFIRFLQIHGYKKNPKKDNNRGTVIGNDNPLPSNQRLHEYWFNSNIQKALPPGPLVNPPVTPPVPITGTPIADNVTTVHTIPPPWIICHCP
jgi:hypothetical protein